MSKTYKPKPVVNLDVPVEDFVIEAADVEALQVEFAEPQKPAESYIAQDGDSYASIAARFKPTGMTKHAYAVHLSSVNSGSLRPGAEIKL